MDTLRASLEIIFNEMKIEPLLKVKEGVDSSLFDKERFQRAYQIKFPSYSIDQCGLTADMVASFYLKADPAASDNVYCPNSSVFNALLHFSQTVLVNKPDLLCDFEHILRWDSLVSILGEDLFTTSYLASLDVHENYNRSLFDWKLVLDQNNALLNKVLSQEMSDVHMHLKGSSGNFDLNWLSIMNYPYNRENQFKKLDTFLSPINIMEASDLQRSSLHALSVKASAIRYYLFLKYVKKGELDQDIEKLINAMVEACDKQAVMMADRLDSVLRSDRTTSNKTGTYLNHDYAWQIDDKEIKKNPNVIIAGERCILYHCFKACFSGNLSSRDSTWLYAYLMIKNRIRRELTQVNGFAGFGNFDSYEKRKTLFFDKCPIYEQLVEPWAIGQYCVSVGDRYIEPRITPKDTGDEIYLNLDKIDKRLTQFTNATLDNVHYVFHFIKLKDEGKINGDVINQRHNQLRERVRKQAMAINDLRKSFPLHNRVVGIDAANSEIFARPEVFAQAFRFIRDNSVVRIDREKVFSLGLTYHVGEDFLSPLDGLRAIDEVLHFLRFKKYDRLGHALVLGIMADRYLRLHHNTLLLPKHIVLDDIAWCLHEISRKKSFESVAAELKSIFYKVFKEVYSNCLTISLSDYYKSWLLRGDNPSRYSSFIYNGKVDLSSQLLEWSRFDFNDDPNAVIARQNQVACELYYRYHYDSLVRERGNEIMELHCPEGMADVIKFIQNRLLKKIQKGMISVETNPTSNRRIGGFELYHDLPVFKFLPIAKSTINLSTSVNTDDRGIFTTSLEREYALLAGALYKGCKDRRPKFNPLNMNTVCGWLERIRENAWDQRFVNYV